MHDTHPHELEVLLSSPRRSRETQKRVLRSIRTSKYFACIPSRVQLVKPAVIITPSAFFQLLAKSFLLESSFFDVFVQEHDYLIFGRDDFP